MARRTRRGTWLVVAAVACGGLWAIPWVESCVPVDEHGNTPGSWPTTLLWIDFHGDRFSGGVSTCLGIEPLTGTWTPSGDLFDESSYRYEGPDDFMLAVTRSPEGHPLRIFSQGDNPMARVMRTGLALHCAPRPAFWQPVRVFLFDRIAFTPPWFALLLGFLFGSLASRLERRALTGARPGAALAAGALGARLLATVAIAGLLDPMGSAWHYPRIPLHLAFVALGQALAATLVSLRQEDVPSPAGAATPTWRMLVLVLSGACCASLFAPALDRAFPTLAAWALLYASLPILLWSVIPRVGPVRLHRAGLALATFIACQCLVGSDTAIRWLNVFLAPELPGWSDRPFQPSAAVLMATAAGIAVLALAFDAARRRRSHRAVAP